MPVTVVNRKYQIPLLDSIRKLLGVKPGDKFDVRVEDEQIILRKITVKKDSLLTAIRKPAHVSTKKIRKTDLEKIEEEMWAA